MEMTDTEITKAATKYMGKPALMTAAVAFGAVFCWAVLFLLATVDIVSLWVALPIVSYLVYVTYTPFHEAVHNNIAGTNRSLRWLNELTGYVVANVLGVSFTMHKYAHMAHHRHTNVAGEDPDRVYTGRHLYDLFTSGSKMLLNEYRDYFTNAFPRASFREKATVVLELTATVGWRVWLGFYFPLEVFVLGVVANVLGVTLLGYIFAWIVHTPFNQTERFKDTSTILLPKLVHGPVTVLWLWQNYHSIHHLFPKVPFFQYRKLFEDIRYGMEERGAPIVVLGTTRRDIALA